MHIAAIPDTHRRVEFLIYLSQRRAWDDSDCEIARSDASALAGNREFATDSDAVVAGVYLVVGKATKGDLFVSLTSSIFPLCARTCNRQMKMLSRLLLAAETLKLLFLAVLRVALWRRRKLAIYQHLHPSTPQSDPEIQHERPKTSSQEKTRRTRERPPRRVARHRS